MNDFTKYKAKKFLMDILGKIILIPFIPGRILYAKNGAFKNWIDKRERQGYKKRAYKREIKRIAYWINENEDNSCSVFFGYDHDMDIPTDTNCSPDSVLLEDFFWIKKNKLIVEEHTLESYCNTYFADKNLINLYYSFSSQKDRTVLILKKP